MKIQILAFLALIGLANCVEDNANPASTGPTSAERGRLVAERVCQYCHEVVPGQPSAIEQAGPSFAEIANLPGRNRANLRRSMTAWHELEKIDMPGIPMSTIMLPSDQREDVISYILMFQRDPARGNLPPTGLKPFQ